MRTLVVRRAPNGRPIDSELRFSDAEMDSFRKREIAFALDDIEDTGRGEWIWNSRIDRLRDLGLVAEADEAERHQQALR